MPSATKVHLSFTSIVPFLRGSPTSNSDVPYPIRLGAAVCWVLIDTIVVVVVDFVVVAVVVAVVGMAMGFLVILDSTHVVDFAETYRTTCVSPQHPNRFTPLAQQSAVASATALCALCCHLSQ
jgi:hypothetical protein